MDPAVAALSFALQQSPPASTPASAAGAASGATPSFVPLSDRCGNAPLFTLEGEPVRLDLTAGAWLARLRGNVSYGPLSTGQLDLNDTYGLDSLEGAFQGDLSLRWKNWVLRFTGSEFSTDATQAAPSAGAFGTTAFAAGNMLHS